MAIELTLTELAAFGGIGALGGVARELVTHPRWQDWKQDYQKFAYQIGSAAVIGGFVGIMVDTSIVISGLAGYAGSDALEELMKEKGVPFPNST